MKCETLNTTLKNFVHWIVSFISFDWRTIYRLMVWNIATFNELNVQLIRCLQIRWNCSKLHVNSLWIILETVSKYSQSLSFTFNLQETETITNSYSHTDCHQPRLILMILIVKMWSFLCVAANRYDKKFNFA